MVSVTAFFVNLFMHSPERYLYRQVTVTLRPKHLTRDQSLHFTPLSETMSISITFIWEFPPGWGAKDVLKINGQIVF